jgi:hypothetical protein
MDQEKNSTSDSSPENSWDKQIALPIIQKNKNGAQVPSPADFRKVKRSNEKMADEGICPPLSL